MRLNSPDPVRTRLTKELDMRTSLRLLVVETMMQTFLDVPKTALCIFGVKTETLKNVNETTARNTLANDRVRRAWVVFILTSSGNVEQFAKLL